MSDTTNHMIYGSGSSLLWWSIPRTATTTASNFVLVGLPDYLQRRLQSVLNAAARLVFRLRRYDHVTDAHATLHWLRLPQRVDFKVAVMTFRVLHGLAVLNQLVRVADLPSRRRLRSTSSHQLLLPSFRLTTVGDGHFQSLHHSCIAIRHPSIFFSVCLPSTSENISFSPVFSWHCALITLRPRGLRNSFAILATLKMFDWHWHWHWRVEWANRPRWQHAGGDILMKV